MSTQHVLWICMDCVIHLVFGADCGGGHTEEDAEKAEKIGKEVQRLGGCIYPDWGEDDGDDYLKFTSSPCSVCHSKLYGGRQRFVCLTDDEPWGRNVVSFFGPVR